MSDNETAPWMRAAAKKINSSLFPAQWPTTVVQQIAEIIAETFAAECRAPAPQLDLDEKNDLDTLRERDQRFDNSEEVKELRELNYSLQQLLSKREATPQVTPELELEWEADGRWLAEFTRFPGVASYGPSKEEAIRNAAKVLIESEQASQKSRDTGVSLDGGKTIHSKFKND